MSSSDEVEVVQRPMLQDAAAWQAYWTAQGQGWRTEPEIAAERQAYLRTCLSIIPDLDQGIYPFKDMPLSRADVEWLLATHEDGRGPVDIYDAQQRARSGVDLRGADLRQVDLHHLPLARMLGGLDWKERNRTPERRNMAAVRLEGAILSWAHLEEAELYMARLERADLYMAHLEGASLRKAHLEGASLRLAHLEGVSFLPSALGDAQQKFLPPADLRAAFFDNTTDLRNVFLGSEEHGFVRLADVQWGDANLGVIDWSDIAMLGDERKARETGRARGQGHERETHINNYREAVRANRQIAVALRSQGLNEEAIGFLYRSQQLARTVLWLQGKSGAYIFSVFLDILAGYGYKPARSIIAYISVVIFFALAYYVLGQLVGPHLSPLGSFIFSLTSFHGRGFFPGGIILDDPITMFAAFEAVIGLAIEISFIATFTQRFFGN